MTDEMQVILRTIPSTGYDWRVECDDGVTVRAAITLETIPIGTPLANEPDDELFSNEFRLLYTVEGIGTAVFMYERAWEKDIPPVKTVRVTVG